MPADALNAAAAATPETAAAEVPTDVFARVLEGDLSGMETFVMTSIVPKLGYAGLGLAVLFVGYFFAKYLSRMISQPIRQRIDETFGRFVGTSIFYCVMGSLLAAVASKLGAPLGGVA